MMIPLIVLGVAIVMMACEVARPGRSWPRVAGWWLRAALLNGVQIAMVFLAGIAWVIRIAFQRRTAPAAESTEPESTA